MRQRQLIGLLIALLFVLAAIIAFRWLQSGGREGTTWASGYTDEGFQAVQVGMTRDQVYALIGKPLSVERKEDEAHLYKVEHWSGISATWDRRRRDIYFQLDSEVVLAKQGGIRTERNNSQ